MTSGTATRRTDARRRAAEEKRHADATRRRRRLSVLAFALVLAGVAAVVSAMMLTSQTTTSTATRPAPDFTLTTTAGKAVHLADLRGHNVLLYFSEGAGCGSCLQQMGAIEKNRAAFERADVTVLPIVMNTREQITADMSTYQVRTPFLLDDGTVSKAYGTLGKGMHEGLPGHSFFLIDKSGVQRWSGEYPSMWLPPTDLLKTIKARLR